MNLVKMDCVDYLDLLVRKVKQEDVDDEAVEAREEQMVYPG